jgi:hypothetical protein
MPNHHAHRVPSHEASELLRNFDPQALVEEVISAGEDWADKDAAASSLEETKRTLLAALAMEHASVPTASGKPLPQTHAESRALSDARYKEHLERMVQARRQANRARVRYDLGRMKLELMRSWLATARSEMRMGSHLP